MLRVQLEDGKGLSFIVTQGIKVMKDTTFAVPQSQGEGKRMCSCRFISEVTFYLPKQVTKPHLSSAGQRGMYNPPRGGKSN